MKILYLPNEYAQQRQREKKRWIYPVLLAMQAQYYRRLGHRVIWDPPEVDKVINNVDKVIFEPEPIDFLKLPPPDRIFTNGFDPKYQTNGNFKYHPASYMQVANGCWHGKCSFCVEQKNTWQVRDPWDVHEELNEIQRLGFKEVFDDSGTFPVGKWLDEFLRVPHPNLTFGCNMRMVDADYKRMKKYGFRMVLFGVESANQKTLDRIQKGTKVEDIKYIEKAARAGLECHIAVMFGYSWETDKDARNTLSLVHSLLKNGIAKTAQASLYRVPNEDNQKDHKNYIKRIYEVAYSPRFWWNKLRNLKTKEDLKYLWRQIKEGLRRD